LAKADGFFAIDNFKANRWVVSFLKIERIAMCKEENTNLVQRVNADRRYKIEKLVDEASVLHERLFQKCESLDMFEQNAEYKKADRIYYKSLKRNNRRLNRMLNERTDLI